MAVALRCSSGCGLSTRPVRGTGMLFITLLFMVTWRSCAGREARAVLGMEERPVLQPRVVTLKCSSGCGLRTRPVRGTCVFVLLLLVMVTWRSCAGRGARAVLGMEECPGLQPRVVTLKCSSGCGLSTRPARGTRIFVISLLFMVTWRSCAGRGARAVLGMEE